MQRCTEVVNTQEKLCVQTRYTHHTVHTYITYSMVESGLNSYQAISFTARTRVSNMNLPIWELVPHLAALKVRGGEEMEG